MSIPQRVIMEISDVLISNVSLVQITLNHLLQFSFEVLDVQFSGFAQSMVAYMILFEYFWNLRLKNALWECCKNSLYWNDTTIDIRT